MVQRNPVHLMEYEKKNNADAARRSGAAKFDGYCILSGWHKSEETVVGMHIYPADTFPDLACYVDNILPGRWRLHTGGDNTFDWVIMDVEERTPIDRVRFLVECIKKTKASLIESGSDFISEYSLMIKKASAQLKRLIGIMQDLISDDSHKYSHLTGHMLELRYYLMNQDVLEI